MNHRQISPAEKLRSRRVREAQRNAPAPRNKAPRHKWCVPSASCGLHTPYGYGYWAVLVVVLFTGAISAQDQQPSEKDAPDKTQSKQLQELQNQKREIELQYNAAHESVAAAKQQLANPDPNRTVDERTLLQAVLSKLQVQEKHLSAMLEATNRLIAEAQDNQTPADADKPPFTASLLLVKADWSKSPRAKEIATELREALKGVNVPKEQLDTLPASATEILFPPRVKETYSVEHWQQFSNWLQKGGLIVETIPFAHVPEKRSEAAGPGGGQTSLGYQQLRRPYSFLDLPPLSVENTQPFFRWNLAFDWSMYLSPYGVPQGPSSATITNRCCIFETTRGEPTQIVRGTLASHTINLASLSEQEVVVFNTFADPQLLEGAVRKGFVALVVVRLGELNAADSASQLVLPDHVEEIKFHNEREFLSNRGGTLIVEPPGSGRNLRRGYMWKESPKAASTTSAEAASAEPSPTEHSWIIVHLKHLTATSAERILKQIYARSRVVIAAEERTNSVVVSGTQKDLDEMAALLEKLDTEAPAGQANAAIAEGAVGPNATVAVAELATAYDAKERRSAELAAEIRNSPADAAAERLDKLKADLRRVVGEAFALRQQVHQAELAKLRERMQRIEQTVEARSRISDAIVQRRVEYLLNPALEWEVGTEAASAPTERSGAGPKARGNQPTSSSMPTLPVPAIGGGGNAATVTLRTPDEFRQQLLSAETTVEQLRETYDRFPPDTAEETKKARKATIERAERRLELLRAEYATQIRLLQLEVNAATAELKNAEEAAEVAEAGFKAAKKPRSEMIEARQQIVAARLRLDRAKTLLDLYRRADPQAGANDSANKPPQ